jgi:hypothetical protein
MVAANSNKQTKKQNLFFLHCMSKHTFLSSENKEKEGYVLFA